MHPGQAWSKRQQSVLQGTSAFFIADTSPLIQYGDGIKSNWTQGYAPQPDGYDQTLHLVSSHETLAVNLSASTLTLLIPAFPGCSATISINSSVPASACATTSAAGDIPFSLNDLPWGMHRVKWDSGPVGSTDRVIFWGVQGSRMVEPTQMTNVTIDDTFVRREGVMLQYQGAWDHLDGKGKRSGNTDVSQAFNSSLAVTSKSGASLSLTGTGSAVYLYGTVGPDHGSASVTLNGELVATRMNLTSPWAMSYELLWFATGLDVSKPFNVSMTSLEDKKMTLDFLVMSVDGPTLSALRVGDRNASFLTTIGGKLSIYLAAPLLVVVLLALGLFCFVRRRRRRAKAAAPMPSAMTSHTDSQAEKRSSVGGWSGFSGLSGHSAEEVFVSYESGRSQRLSERWTSPTSPGDSRQLHRNPSVPSTRTLPALPEGQSMQGSPVTEDGSNGTWSRPIRSLLASSFTTDSDTHRRETHLPPYSPGQTGTAFTENSPSDPFPSSEYEKAAQLLQAVRVPPGSSIIDTAGPSRHIARASTVAPSEVLSVFGQPPSERRDSAMTSFSHLPMSQTPLPHSSPALPPTRPKINTDVDTRHASTPVSALTSSPIHSAMPLLRASPVSAWRDLQASKHGRSTTTGSVVSNDGSAARPDSDVIPFETFARGLRLGGKI
ncbi:hypothetical protein DB88DRAFT_495781 [Papiliotrema laurentii]|uniref:Transmembrane protein n=1 Tax=Papiliotrema laurentii TaxID=5418 RepID=A0AAD9CY81_PAPLA|nr:hypothetical protein DB88DRAFT_495781 [Papiliotrema laurentii]